MKSILSKTLIIVGILIIAIGLSLTFLNKNNASDNKDNEQKEEAKEEPGIKDKVYSMERPFYYKEVNGKIVERSDSDYERSASIDYSIHVNNFVEESFDTNLKHTLIVKNIKDNYKLTISIDSNKFMNYHDIVLTNDKDYGITNINEKYKVGDKTVLKQEYPLGQNEVLEYYYLFKNGLYIEYKFEFDINATINYEEVEKLLNFDLKENS